MHVVKCVSGDRLWGVVSKPGYQIMEIGLSFFKRYRPYFTLGLQGFLLGAALSVLALECKKTYEAMAPREKDLTKMVFLIFLIERVIRRIVSLFRG